MKNQGFTLIEILMAMVVIATIIPMAMWVQSTAWGGTGKANKLRLASQLIQSQVDSIKVRTVSNDTTPPCGSYTGSYRKGVQVSYTISEAYRDETDPATRVDNACKVSLTARDANAGDTLLVVQTFVTRDF